MAQNTKHIILTGGTSGIGKILLEKYSNLNYKIILGVENPKETIEQIKLNNKILNKNLIEIKELNLNSFQSISNFIKNIQKCHKLINCAGKLYKNYEIEEKYEKTMLTNYLGHFLLSNLLLNKIIQTSINDNNNDDNGNENDR